MGEVFLSYNHKDEDFVQELYRRLSRDGVDCFFDKQSIAWGANWVTELEKGIDRCEHIVFVLSPEFCKSEWTKLERTGAMADDPSGMKRKLRPLILKPCGDSIPRFLKPIQHIDVSTPQKFEEAYPKICTELGGRIVKKDFTADRSSLPPVSDLPDRHRMPYRSLGKGFVGRIAELWEIDDILRNRKTAVVEGVGVVAGTGGLGKTQLAIEYVHRFGMNYSGGVFWVNAEQDLSTLILQVSQGAGVNIDNTLEEDQQLHQLWKQLSTFPPILIILDNFPEQGSLQPWLPSSGSIHTLVTTRRRDLSKYSRLPLNFLSPEEGLDLLNSGDRDFGSEAVGLVKALGGLPLALELAQNFLNLRPALSIDDLLKEIERTDAISNLDLLSKKYADELPSGHIKEVAATIQLSWDLATERGKGLLQCISLLAPVPVPRRLLRKILDFPDEGIVKDPIADTISELVTNLSLLEWDEDNDPWAHRLISAFVRITIGNSENLFEKVVGAVETEMNRATDEKDVSSLRELEKIVPHADHLLFSKPIKTEKAIDISDSIRWHYRKLGKYRLAEKYGLISLDLSQQTFESGHPTIAISQSNLATVLKDLGDLEGAKTLLQQALASAQQTFEPGHPTIAIRQSNLASVLQDLGDLEGAKALLQQALASHQQTFEPGHPTIAISQSNLATVLKDLGDLEGAKALLQQALASHQQTFEPGHPTIAISQSNLATVLQDLGDLEGAKALLQQALVSDQQTFEPGHPTIASSQSNLATVLKDLGDLEGAKALLQQALVSDQQTFEPGHPTIAISQSKLASVLKDLGDLEGAKALLQQGFDTLLNKFGPQHHYTKIVKKILDSISTDK